MKKEMLFLFVFSLLSTFTISAQTASAESLKAEAKMERGRKAKAELDAISNISPALKSFRGDDKALIMEATRSGSPAVIPHLKVLASDQEARTQMGSSAFQAHIALGKLGDPNVLPEISVELSTGNYLVQDAAIAKLAQIGNKEAYQKLFELLDDNANRDDNPADDALVIPNSYRVMEELAKIFDDTPYTLSGTARRDISAWKTWIKNHNLLIK